MLERGGTDEISIRAGTVCTVKGITWHVRKKILLGCVDGIPSAAEAAAARGDVGAAGRLRDKDYRHCLRLIGYNVLAVTIYQHYSLRNLSC
jgi:hypothetical protein